MCEKMKGRRRAAQTEMEHVRHVPSPPPPGEIIVNQSNLPIHSTGINIGTPLVFTIVVFFLWWTSQRKNRLANHTPHIQVQVTRFEPFRGTISTSERLVTS